MLCFFNCSYKKLYLFYYITQPRHLYCAVAALFLINLCSVTDYSKILTQMQSLFFDISLPILKRLYTLGEAMSTLK